jgi:predicted small lipoprotein YifL
MRSDPIESLGRMPLIAALIAVLTACGGGGPVDTPTAQEPSSLVAAQTPAETPIDVAPPPAAETVVAVEPIADAQPVDAQPIADVLVAPDVVAQALPSDGQRAAAASATAQSPGNACGAIRPFYWELGNKNARLANGSVYATGSKTGYTATTPLSVASSSKWLYAAYVAQKQAGALSDSDRRFLSMRSGYVSLNTSSCQNASTVNACLAIGNNGAYTKAADGKFFYDGGHMQKHASLIGLGAMGNAALASALRGQIGSDVDLTFSRPQLAGGVVMTSDAYARFLRKMLAGQLRLGSMLGSSSVCTNPANCSTALAAPVPRAESWHYSLGHWVEDDPKVGDGAFSSAGSFGFYPWIDAGRTSYGIIGRMAPEGSGYDSAKCGRLIRKAWSTGVAV